MKYIDKKFTLVLFVLSTTLVLGSAVDAYAADRGTTGTGSIEACLNLGQPPNFSPCDTEDEWSGGNITNDAGYKEGASIPVRVDITGLENGPGIYNELVIEWDITKTQAKTVKHTFDYITSFDRNDNPHPCLVLVGNPVCAGYGSDSEDIPVPGTLDPLANVNNASGVSQPETSFLELEAIGETKFWMFAENGTVNITDIKYLSEGNPAPSGTSNTEMTQLLINYTSTSSHVIAAFGAHIASPVDWEFAAVSVNGKSFQISCEEVKENGGCDGGQINLDAFDVIDPIFAPTLTLKKNVTSGGATPDQWLLTADDDDTKNGEFTQNGDGLIAFVVEPEVTYFLTEDGPPGYQQTGDWDCGNVGVFEDPNKITLSVNQDITCTITNDIIIPTLTITKTVTNNNGGLLGISDFPLFIDGSPVTSGVANNVTANALHTVTETTDSGYAASAWGGDCAADGTITLLPGDVKTCTITNDDVAPTLTIIKNITNNNGIKCKGNITY